MGDTPAPLSPITMLASRTNNRTVVSGPWKVGAWRWRRRRWAAGVDSRWRTDPPGPNSRTATVVSAVALVAVIKAMSRDIGKDLWSW
jgi:hypothetical protein